MKYEELANMFADMIEKNNAPWQKPWTVQGGFLPQNIKSGNEYRGINALHLIAVMEKKGYADNRFLTFKQAKELGGSVRAGEKGIPIMYLQTTERVVEVDEQVIEKEIIKKLENPRAMWTTVFNAEQCDNLPAREIKNLDFNPNEKAQEYLDKSGAVIKHKNQDRAFYSPMIDEIHLPNKENFHTSEDYYRTALHELGHWTGHENRLNRSMQGSFGSEEYAKEELVAEIASFFIGSKCGLGHEPDEQNIAYIKGWANKIRNDPSYLFNAIKQADAACQYITNERILEKDNLKEQNQNNEKEAVKMSYQNIYINVPKAEKEQAKELGAKWDANNICWFVPADKDLSLFHKWERIDEKDLIARKEQLLQKKKENGIEKGFFKDLTVNFAWSEWDFGIKDDTILKGEEAYKFLDKLVKADAEQNKIQERKRQGEVLDSAYYYKTKFAINYKSHQSETVRVDVGDLEFGGKEKVSDGIEDRAKSYSAILIPKTLMTDFKNEEAKYLEYIQQKEKQNMKNQKYILAVPYNEKDKAKALGAEWDKDGKFWYCKASEKDKFFEWDIKNKDNNTISFPVETIEEKFYNEIVNAGVIENEIIADGQKHRIAVEGDKGKEQSGFYVLHSDGVANGYFMNNRTGEEIRWKDNYQQISAEEREQLKALHQAKKAEREKQDMERTEKAEKQLFAKYMNKEAVSNDHAYLKAKGISVTDNIYAGYNNTITVPLHNVEGRLKAVQYISEEGEKRFSKDTNKVSAFHMLEGNVKDLQNANTIIVAEGYATAASINEAVKDAGIKVVAAMSASNLEDTVAAINEKYPNKSFIIAADNDLNNTVGNIGLNAAKAVTERFSNVSIAVPKLNGTEISGDFNDVISKCGLSKEDALKSINKSITKMIKQERQMNPNEKQQDLGKVRVI